MLVPETFWKPCLVFLSLKPVRRRLGVKGLPRLSSVGDAEPAKEEAPCGGATGLLEMDAPVGEPVQTGHVSARRGHYRLKRRYPE